jgi:eukaryotic-like serine/threonine-protein kinase
MHPIDPDQPTLTLPELSGRAVGEAPEPGARLGRFHLLERIGAGGMGVVFAAHDPELERSVAIKILRGGGPEEQTRLLREAQALARLSHPNVLTVYEVGSWREEIFLAMELVPGSNLETWLRQEPRSRREILEIFRQAGQGLEAAHAADLVHRDFKPHNVMVRPDGRALVVDFGLATSGGSDETVETPGEGAVLSAAELARPGTLPEAAGEVPRTAQSARSGPRLGTPSFMAPEGQSSAAADQYSFCVSLYRALVGRFPQDHRPDPDALRQLPRGLRRLLQRGLDREPSRRYPSMVALLHDLPPDPWRRWRRWAAFVGLPLLVAVPLSLLLLRGPGPCAGAGDKLGEIWNPERRAAISAAFRATDKPYATRLGSGIQDLLEDYGRAWVAMRTEACQASRIRGEQSAELLDRRMECLDQRWREMDALLTVLENGPATDLADRGADAVTALTPLERCADATALLAPLPPPHEGEEAERVRTLRRSLAEAKALRDAGRYPEGLALAEPTVETARELGYWPLTAEAWLEVGLLRAGLAEPQQADEALGRALLAAQAGGHDHAAAAALIYRVRVSTYQEGHLEEGRLYGEYAQGLLATFQHPEELAADLADHLGLLALQSGDPTLALAHHREALEQGQRLLGPDHPRIARTLLRLSNALMELGEPQAAIAPTERARKILENAFGPAHPLLGVPLDRAGVIAFQLGHLAQAREYYTRALAIKEGALGPDHPRIATARMHLGNLEATEGHYGEALAHFRRAEEIYRSALGENHPHVALVLSNLGSLTLLQGRATEAAGYYRQALEIQRAAYGDDHPWVATTAYNLAEALREGGQPAAARPLYEWALKIWREKYGAHQDGHPLIARGLTGLGLTLLRLGAPQEARSLAEEGLAMALQVETDPVAVAESRFAVAQALRATGGEARSAEALARQALATFAATSGNEARTRAVEDWLRPR